MVRLYILIGVSIAFISGCVTAQPVNIAPRTKFIDYSKIKPDNHELRAVKYAENVLRNTFMNPTAMRLDTSETGNVLKLGICQGDQLYNRNKPYTLFFKDGEVIASQQADARDFDGKPVAGGFYFPCNDVH